MFIVECIRLLFTHSFFIERKNIYELKSIFYSYNIKLRKHVVQLRTNYHVQINESHHRLGEDKNLHLSWSSRKEGTQTKIKFNV